MVLTKPITNASLDRICEGEIQQLPRPSCHAIVGSCADPLLFAVRFMRTITSTVQNAREWRLPDLKRSSRVPTVFHLAPVIDAGYRRTLYFETHSLAVSP